MATATPIQPRIQNGVRFACDWAMFRQIAEQVAEQHIRVYYDGKEIVLMSPGDFHARAGFLLGQFVTIVTKERRLPAMAFGDTLWKSDALRRAAMGDAAFYLAHARQLVGKPRLDLGVDPPPDLVIEVDITSTDVDKEAIYARLGVPELWRYDGAELRILRLSGGAYAPGDSLAFPGLPPAEVARLVQDHMMQLDDTFDDAVRAWVAATYGP